MTEFPAKAGMEMRVRKEAPADLTRKPRFAREITRANPAGGRVKADRPCPCIPAA